MRWTLGALMLVSVGCGGGGPGAPDVDAAPPLDGPGAHHARFVGTWAVEQPFHAAYEVTYYALAADGAVTVGPSDPAGCLGHLERHCVTGSVARCTAADPGAPCLGPPSCVFGARWYSLDERTLAIAGVCSDQVARDLVVELAADPATDTAWGGAGGTLVTVGGEAGWAHDGWDWAFRKCPAGTTPATCLPP